MFQNLPQASLRIRPDVAGNVGGQREHEAVVQLLLNAEIVDPVISIKHRVPHHIRGHHMAVKIENIIPPPYDFPHGLQR